MSTESPPPSTALDLVVDRAFASRLLLGALTEHEQRRLATRLAELDSALRLRLRDELSALAAPADERFDELVTTCERLAADADTADRALDEARATLLETARRHADLDAVLAAYTYAEAMRLGAAARRLFTWPMAEHLLDRAAGEQIGDREARTAHYLATAVVDGLDILGAVGALPRCPSYAAVLRRRLAAIRSTIG